jgi:hypothetical protein
MRIVEFERIGERSILGIVTREAMWGSGHMEIFRVYGSVITLYVTPICPH